MTVGAFDHGMLSFQHKRIMIEFRAIPRQSFYPMAYFAFEWKILLPVVGKAGAVIVFSMAKYAFRWQSFINTAAMALGTIRPPMHSVSREITVCKSCTFP
jgi:hypothetical protein